MNKPVLKYRVGLVKDGVAELPDANIQNSSEASRFFRELITKHGQPDREQFVVALLDSKNRISGFNIVSMGSLNNAAVMGREVLKPAILGNSCAMVFCHNHPSGDCAPSVEDEDVTCKLVISAKMIGVIVHDHIIVSMLDNRYYSFADNGLIKKYENKFIRMRLGN
jgi:DNA repair protein RadC